MKNTLPVIIILFLLTLIFVSCRAVKSESSSVKINTDSIVTAKVDSEARSIRNSFSTRLREVMDSLSSRVVFQEDTIPCPPVNCDSSELEHYREVVRSLQNKIIIKANGDREYIGRIAYLQEQSNHWGKELDSAGETIDYWINVHHEDSLRYVKLSEEKQKVIVKKANKTIILWGMLIIAILFFLAGWKARERLKNADQI